MDLFAKGADFQNLPKLGCIDVNQLWQDLQLTNINFPSHILEEYRSKHDEWTEKIRIIGLDAGILVNFKTLPGLDRLVDYLHAQTGWARPEIYVVADIGRKGIDSWSGVSVVSRTRPVILLGVDLVNSLNESELSFVIAHETGHLLNYTGLNQDGITLSFLIRDYIENNREAELEELLPGYDWRHIYSVIMGNCRTVEIRCDRLGLLICGNHKNAARALLAATLRNVTMARSINLENYLAIQTPLLHTSPEASPISVNVGHPFIPFRIMGLQSFVNSGKLEYYTRLFMR